MPAKDLGLKHTCWKCSTKFYDLKKANAVCPKCGADPREAPVAKPAPAAERRRAREEAAAAVVPEVATEVEEADLEEEPEDVAEEDADEAGDDE